MYRFVLNPKYARMLIRMGNETKNIDSWSSEFKVDGNHLSTVIRQFRIEGLIESVKDGNSKNVILTVKGKRIIGALEKLMQEIDKKDEGGVLHGENFGKSDSRKESSSVEGRKESVTGRKNVSQDRV